MATTNLYTVTLAPNEVSFTLENMEGFKIIGNNLNNLLTGNLGNDQLSGDAGADTLLGGDGNDTLTGGLGADSMVGGIGNDSYQVNDFGDVIVELADEGIDAVSSSISMTLGNNIEQLYAAQSGLTLIGNGAANYIRGSDGADSLYGGDGNDVIYTFNANPNSGGNDLVHGGNGNDIIHVGGATASEVFGDAGDDAFYMNYSSTHRSNVKGGLGNDTYIVTNTLTSLTEASGEGIDTVRSTISFSLQAGEMTSDDGISLLNGEVEGLVLISHANINGLGNALNNMILGAGGDNLLDGRGGSDVLAGNDGSDTLLGGDGHDTLDGGLGVDSMVGGLGNDKYIVDNEADVALELANQGVDMVRTKISLTLADNIEQLFADTDHLTLTGNELDNYIRGSDGYDTIYGGDGNDTIYNVASDLVHGGGDSIHGGNGNDILHIAGDVTSSVYGDAGDDWLYLNYGSHPSYALGGTGNDNYVINNAKNSIQELPGEGVDTIRTTVTMSLKTYEMVNIHGVHLLIGEVENLVMISNDNIDGLGNELNNMMLGGAGNNLINGREGNDFISGNGGNDTLLGGNGNDYLYVATAAGGGVGVATLSGEAGNDVFYMGRYLTSNPAQTASNVIITDFTSGQDKIRFDIAQSLGVSAPAALTKITPTAGDTLVSLLDKAAGQPSNGAAKLVSFQFSGDTYVVLDTNTSVNTFSATDAAIKLTGLVNLQTSDFACVLVA